MRLGGIAAGDVASTLVGSTGCIAFGSLMDRS
jgi:hypothetical protein